MPYLEDAFAEIREVEAFTSRSAKANEVARTLTRADAARIEELAAMYPHFSPDSLMAVGRSGLDPRSPQVFQVAEIEARKMQREHPLGRRYGAPAVTPGQRRTFDLDRRQGPPPSWKPQSGNPDATAAWDEAQRSGLVLDGVLTRPDGPDWERLGDRYEDVLDRLTAAGEAVPVMELSGDTWSAKIARRAPEASVTEQMHAGGPEATRQAQRIQYQDIEAPDQAAPPVTGGGSFGSGIGGGVAGRLPGPREQRQYEIEAARGTQAAGITGLREAFQGTFAIMDVPVQEFQGQIRNLYGQTHGKSVDWWEAQSDYLIQQTSSVDDMGQGFFVDQESEVAQERRSREEERGQIGGHNITLGRWAADAAPFATDSKPSLIMSGFVDLGVQIADPTAWLLGRFGKAGMARRFFQAPDLASQLDEGVLAAIRNAPDVELLADSKAGVINGLRRVLDTKTGAAFLDSKDGAARLQWTAGETSPYRTWRGYNRKISFDLARRLADSHTPEEARAILEPELGTRIKDVNTVSMPGITDVSSGGTAYRDPFRAAGAPGQMPLRGPIDAHNQDIVGREIESWLHNAKATDDEIARHVDAVARAQTPHHLNAAIRDTLRDADGILARSGIEDPILRKKLTAISQTAHEEASTTFKAAQSAQTPTWNDLVANDVPVHSGGANLWIENSPQYLTLPDPRDIRRAVSKHRRILQNPDTGDLRLGFSTLDFLQNDIWKPMQLVTRIAWPVRVIAEEQVRMAAAGYDSMFKNPMSYIAWGAGRKARSKTDSYWAEVAHRLQTDIRTPGDVLGRKGQTTVMGQLIEEQNEFKASLTRNNGGWMERRISSPNAITYHKGNALSTALRGDYTKAVASDLLRLHSDPVAHYIANGTGLDDAKRWFSEGAGLEYKGGLAATHPGKFDTRAQADAYMEIVAQRLQHANGGNTEIADIVRTGKFNGADIFDGDRIDPKFVKWLDTKMDEFGPEQIVGDAPTGTFDRGLSRYRGATDRMFSILMGERTNNLSRSRVFKQAYWQEAGRLMAFATPEARAAIRAAAEEAGVTIPRRAVKKSERAAAGTLELEDVDNIAKGHGLDTTRELLYDLTRRGRKMDAMRLVFPFGEAWSEVLTRWFGTGLAGGDTVGLVWQNPKTIRRFQQIMQGARGEDLGEVMGAPEGQGFFWKNGFGEEVFIYPGSQILTEHVLGIPVPLSGRVQGLSMFGTVMPGLGLVAQIPVGWLMSAKPGPQEFKEFLNDFEQATVGVGGVDFGTVKEQILPFGSTGAEDQADVGNFFKYVPPWIRNLAQSVTEGDLDSAAYASDTMDTMAYLRSTGKYGDSPEDLQQLAEDAQNQVRGLYFIRALAGGVAPAAPDFEFMVENDQGKLLRLAALREEFFGMLDEDPRTAGQTFLDKYGTDIHAIVSTSQTTSSRRGTPTDAAGVAWVLEHPGIEDDLPYTYGMFAPTGGPDDFALYREEMRKGQRVRLDPETWNNRLINNTKGDMLWRQAQQEVQGRSDKGAQQWLRDVADEIRADYPGWGDTTDRLEGTETEQLVSELERAVNHPAVRDTDAADGLRLYLDAREAALDNAKSAGVQHFNEAKSMEGTRVWLNDVASEIMAEHPDFEPLWRWVFSREAEMQVEE